VSSASHSAARSALRPGPRALFVAPRPAPEAPASPSRPQRRPTQPGCPGSGARPAPSAAGTPATHCRSARPPRGCRGSRTASGTSHARSSVEQGDCTSPEPGTPAHVASRRDAGGRKVRKCADAKGTREQASNVAKTRAWKIRHEGPLWTRNASFTVLLIEAS
jgi:hypothetical protein